MPKEFYLLDNDELLKAFKQTRMRRSKLIFGALALIMLASGLAIYCLSNALGIASKTAELMAGAFLIAGLIDYLILHFWDHIYSRFG